jgi:hypothetical protein
MLIYARVHLACEMAFHSAAGDAFIPSAPHAFGVAHPPPALWRTLFVQATDPAPLDRFGMSGRRCNMAGFAVVLTFRNYF